MTVMTRLPADHMTTCRLTLLLMAVNLALRQCMHTAASLSGTHTAACSVAGCLSAASASVRLFPYTSVSLFSYTSLLPLPLHTTHTVRSTVSTSAVGHRKQHSTQHAHKLTCLGLGRSRGCHSQEGGGDHPWRENSTVKCSNCTSHVACHKITSLAR